jgi:hypothetical protein
MPKRKDENEIAFAGLQELMRRDAERDGLPVPPVEPEPKDPKKVKAGKIGGRKGGLTRAANLTPRKRRQIAKKAAKTRWSKRAE